MIQWTQYLIGILWFSREMKVVVLLAAVAVLAITSTDAIFIPRHHIRTLYEAPPLPERNSNRVLDTQWIDQRIDNFDPQNEATYRMVMETKQLMVF